MLAASFSGFVSLSTRHCLRHPDIVAMHFDFRLHPDRSKCSGTQYFEFVPGPYRNAHWVPGARFVHENTFCLFEGIFENRLPGYDHFAYVNVSRAEWVRSSATSRPCAG